MRMCYRLKTLVMRPILNLDLRSLKSLSTDLLKHLSTYRPSNSRKGPHITANIRLFWSGIFVDRAAQDMERSILLYVSPTSILPTIEIPGNKRLSKSTRLTPQACITPIVRLRRQRLPVLSRLFCSPSQHTFSCLILQLFGRQ